MRQKLFLLLAALLLTGCAAGAKKTADVAEAVPPSTEPFDSLDNYTDKQKELLEYYWGEETWEDAVLGGMATSTLLGTGQETGHKTTGIFRCGFEYEGNREDIPESGDGEMLTCEVIEKWTAEEKEFRLAEIAPYQHTLQWRNHQPLTEPKISDTEAEKEQPYFTITIPVDYSVCPCEMMIRGHAYGGKIYISDMLVSFKKEGQGMAGSVYAHINAIRTMLRDEEQEYNHIAVDIMAGSVDEEGCYLVFTNNTDREYTVADEEALLDGNKSVHISTILGVSAAETEISLVAGLPEGPCYAEWDSLERGEHELAVMLTDERGKEKQITVPFTY